MAIVREDGYRISESLIWPLRQQGINTTRAISEPRYEASSKYSAIQTFYADPEIVNNAGEVFLTSVDLYFKTRPSQVRNASGMENPGVSVQICEVKDDEPDLTRIYKEYISYKTYDQISAFADSSVSTTFSFPRPINIKTGRSYGIVITFDDPGFVLWQNKAGDKIIGSAESSPGTNAVKDGRLFLPNNAGVFRPISDTDLKFELKCAQITANTYNGYFVNKSYEFFTVENNTGRFLGGEFVYQESATLVGNVAVTQGSNTIIGTGTSFTTQLKAGDNVVIWSNSTYTEALTVDTIANDTYFTTTIDAAVSNTDTNFMLPPSGLVHLYDAVDKKLWLVNSNANSTLKFTVAGSLVGEDSRATADILTIDALSLDKLRLGGTSTIPSRGNITTKISTAYANTDSIVYFRESATPVPLNSLNTFQIKDVNAQILSRSEEVDNSNLFSNTSLFINRKSIVVNTDISIDKSNTELYSTPTMTDSHLDLYCVQHNISNTTLANDANTVLVDTEVFPTGGTALSKYVSKKLDLSAGGRAAEDVRVFMTAYKPANTNLQVYARVHNAADSDAFDDRQWTPLEYKTNGGVFSSSDDTTDVIEYELGLPQFPESRDTLAGTFSTQLSNNELLAEGVTPSSLVQADDLIKIYNPLIPSDYQIGVVDSANATHIVFGDLIANNDLVGTGFKVDRLKYYSTAFNNQLSDNVARYYSSSLVEYDKFDTLQIKIVFVSDTSYIVPRVDSVQVAGVSS